MALEAQTLRPDSLIRKDDGRQFWQDCDADEDAMIDPTGRFPGISETDLQGSRKFLAKLGIGPGPGLRVVPSALEGGAGVGRFTRAVLLHVAEQVDAIEPIAKFIERLKSAGGVREAFNLGLEEWEPEEDVKYDLIWNQWCTCNLTDSQLVQYLRKCKTILRPQGVIILKENISPRGFDIFDAIDSTVTREDRKFVSLFKEAGLRLVAVEVQRGLPKSLLPVKMYALAPSEGGSYHA